MTWFQFSILTQNIVPWLSNFDSFFALLTFGDQVLKGVDETGGVSNNFGLIQVWGHTVWCGLVWTPKSVIFGVAFSTSLPLYIYHWRRLDTFDTILIVQNVCPRTPQGSKIWQGTQDSSIWIFFHCVCLLLIWQYRNVYSIRHHSSFFSSVGRIFPSLQRHVLALWRQVRQIEPTHNGGIVFLKSYSTCHETYFYIFNLDQNEKNIKSRLSTECDNDKRISLLRILYPFRLFWGNQQHQQINCFWLKIRINWICFFVLASGGTPYLSWNRRGIKIWMRLHREMSTYLCSSSSSSSICEILHQVT